MEHQKIHLNCIPLWYHW